MLDGRHASRSVVDAGERDTAEFLMHLLQPFPEFGQKMGMLRVFVLEGQPQTFDQWVASDLYQLLPRLFEHFALPRRVAEQSADPATRRAACHPISPCPYGGP